MTLHRNLNKVVLLSALIYLITSIAAAYFYYRTESTRYLSEQLISSGINAAISDNISKGNILPIVYVLCDIIKYIFITLLMIISSSIFGFSTKSKPHALIPVTSICLISASFLCLKNISILYFVFTRDIEGYSPTELNVFSLASFFDSNNSEKSFLNLIGIDTITSIVFYACCIGSNLRGREILRILGSGLFIAITDAGVVFCMGKLS